MRYLKYDFKLNIFVLIGVLFLANCGSSIPIRVPKYPDGNAGAQLREVMGDKRSIGIVASEQQGQSYSSEWNHRVESSVESAIVEYGYYKLIDTGARKERLRELAYTQSGLTAVQKNIGRELAIDGLLYITVSGNPRSECGIENDTVTRYRPARDPRTGQITQVPYYVTVHTGVRNYVLPVRARLVNVETGRAVTASFQEANKTKSSEGDTNCPSEVEAQGQAISKISYQIANTLSPVMVVYQIPVKDGVKDLADSQQDEVKALLKQGITFAGEGDWQMAGDSWKEALNRSGGRSRSALWNLAAYSWFQGDMAGAENYFKQAMRPAENNGKKTSLMEDSSLRAAWLLFRQEKDRKANE